MPYTSVRNFRRFGGRHLFPIPYKRGTNFQTCSVYQTTRRNIPEGRALRIFYGLCLVIQYLISDVSEEDTSLFYPTNEVPISEHVPSTRLHGVTSQKGVLCVFSTGYAL
jgi:hypothetical protein